MKIFKKKAEIEFSFEGGCWQAAESASNVGDYVCTPILRFNTSVNGTLMYQGIIASADDARRRAGQEYLPAGLIREPDNAHDENAVQVVIGGHVVGYLPREIAVKVAEDIDVIENEGLFVAAKVKFVGGRDGLNYGLKVGMPDIAKLAKSFE